MNGSRSAPSRTGDRSSLEALNRTIEGLEARIEGLMSGTARDPRAAMPTPPAAPRAASPARSGAFPSDPLAEIRERQRMLDRNRNSQFHDEPRRAAAPRHEAQRAPIRPPEAQRAPERYAPARSENLRYADARPSAPLPRREELRREDLRQPIPARAPAPQAPRVDPAMQEIAQALVSLRQELKQDISEGVAREMNALRSEIRSIRSVAEDQRFNEELRSDLTQLAESINQLGHQATPEVAALKEEFEELRAVMDGLAREDSVRRMETRWQGLEDRMQEQDSAALREELVALAYRIDDIKSQLGEMSDSPVIRALEQKLLAVAGAMEQLGTRMQPNDAAYGEQFAALDQRLDEISRAIAASSHAASAARLDQAFLQRVESRIGALAEQIDMIGQTAYQQPDPTEALSARLEALTARISDLADEQAAMRLEERLEQLSRMLEQNQRPAHDSELVDYLADISRKIDGLEQGSVNDALGERLDYLARRIEEMEIAPRLQPAELQAFDRIEDRLSDIASRLDEATAQPRHDESALRSLEDQIAHLSVLISQPQPAAGLPADFDNRMSAIENYMATNDEYVIEAARQAAETVVEAYSRNASGGAPMAAADMAALTALADDLRHLEDLTRSSEERTHHTFEALHGTLVQIANRLDGMEERFSAPQPVSDGGYTGPERRELARGGSANTAFVQAPASPETVMQEELAHVAWDQTSERASGGASAPAAAPREQAVEPAEDHAAYAEQPEAESRIAAPQAAKPSLLTQLSRRFMPGSKAEAATSQRAVVDPTPSLDPTDVLPADLQNDLIEPGSGAPDVKKILERVRASQASGDFDAERSSGAARADYIAAARRAAKAAAQEVDPSQPAAATKDYRRAMKSAGKPAAAGKMSQFRRPILMAVGAVLLALMAMPLARTLTSGSEAPSAALPTAQVEAPAEPTVAEMQPEGQLPASEDQAATDGADDMDFAAAEAEPPAPEPEPVQSANRLADPNLTNGQPSAIEPPDAAPAQQDNFIAASTTADAPIAVPAGLEPKSLADAAAAGDPNALFEIGARYTDGRGVKADPSEAANWYKLAADRGLAPAQYRIANIFEKGTGVARDLNKAISYYEKAAEAGNASAMHNLAVLYASGATGQPDYVAAVKWFAKAADFGVADSQFNLAILYARGNGVKQDLEQSYKWFAVAAKDGDQDAAQKRDEVANAMRKEQLESAKAKVEAWSQQPLDPKANSVDIPDEWATGQAVTTSSVDMEKAIRNIQGILTKNGFDAGRPDGKMGAKTIAAIKAFQTSVGQEPTGKINDALVKELLARNK
ncbi:peptidoglycan-binding protein [Rhizobium sp. NTR19]|uniref:Peptidoglycan-binding protein n=1 Tax=Neorhizobium turbinariae TaxID=2937795 RepID=A0ABT0IQT4_9HYPH|nr:SEL1-like repeat protein [Neorhizobium turbinariae]MCK8780229.1 peptidoglycan-binding protein [Neorhizobium turbinariae]